MSEVKGWGGVEVRARGELGLGGCGDAACGRREKEGRGGGGRVRGQGPRGGGRGFMDGHPRLIPACESLGTVPLKEVWMQVMKLDQLFGNLHFSFLSILITIINPVLLETPKSC